MQGTNLLHAREELSVVPKDSGISVLAVLLIGLIFVATIIVPIGSAALIAPSQMNPSVGDDSFQRATPQQNNSSIQQKNPDTVNVEGDLSGVEGWLSNRMGQTLIDCTNGLNVSQYDVCNKLNRDYPNWLDKYVDIAQKTESTDDDNASTSFKRAAKNQRNYSSKVQEFNETKTKYREARQNGETARARELARELRRIAIGVNNTDTNLTQNYYLIDNTSTENLTGATATVNAITQNITETVAKIEQAQFVNTRIKASAQSNQISFLDPLIVTGKVSTKNGPALAFTTVELRTKTRILRTTTNLGGEFNFSYRPTRLPVDTQQVTIRHAPADDSKYLGSQTTVSVEIRQIKPEINATRHSNRVGFNDTVLVNGRITANNTGVPSLPITISSRGQQLDRSRSSGQGGFGVHGRLPATIPAGDQSLQVTYPLKGRALAPTNASIPLNVVSTPTVISVSASQANQSKIRVSGRLRTENGTPLATQTVRLQLNETTVGTIQTGSNGSYRTNITVPQSIIADRSGTVPLTLVAVYDNTETNLGRSQATTQVEVDLPTVIQSPLDQLIGILEAIPPKFRLALGAIVVFVVGVVSIYTFRRGDSGEAPTGTSTKSQASRNRAQELGFGALLNIARKQVTAGNPEQGVMTAYGAVRRRLDTEFEHVSPRTHWEFLAACRSRLFDQDRLTSLQTLTEIYEQAAFAPDAPSTNSATEAIETADRFDSETASTENDSEATN